MTNPLKDGDAKLRYLNAKRMIDRPQVFLLVVGFYFFRFYFKGVIFMFSERYNLQSEAEGVEDREQFEVLRELNCDAVQGFYFSRPIHVEAFELRLQNK